ncbi:MAG TPA: HD domain-containing protein [Candidatus Saccharimonadales bacterium]|nr:HD domain-containing protein [Candidatus Saccharimonadales bacterium]
MTKQGNLPSMDRLMELQQLIADFADIKRMVPIMDKQRSENDVEHSYGLALTCWFLAPKIAPTLALTKILKYALAHDIVEIHSGDVFAFDKKKVHTKDAQEDRALNKLGREWADFPELVDAARTYKNKSDAEARFVYAVDKILPAIMTKIGVDEKFWTKHKITREMHETEKRTKMSHSPEVLPYVDLINEWMLNPDRFYKPSRAGQQM